MPTPTVRPNIRPPKVLRFLELRDDCVVITIGDGRRAAWRRAKKAGTRGTQLVVERAARN